MKNTRKNASGKYLEMNDEQYDRYLAAHKRAVQRQIEQDAERARISQAKFRRLQQRNGA